MEGFILLNIDCVTESHPSMNNDEMRVSKGFHFREHPSHLLARLSPTFHFLPLTHILYLTLTYGKIVKYYDY